IRFEFPARGSMPPVTLYWYDGMKQNPKLEGVPEGEIIGDIPNPRAGGRGPGRGAAAAGGAPAAPPRPMPTGFVGPVFNYEEFDTMMKAAKEAGQPPRMPSPDGSLFVG